MLLLPIIEPLPTERSSIMNLGNNMITKSKEIATTKDSNFFFGFLIENDASKINKVKQSNNKVKDV
jgi:hypothetical protein